MVLTLGPAVASRAAPGSIAPAFLWRYHPPVGANYVGRISGQNLEKLTVRGGRWAKGRRVCVRTDNSLENSALRLDLHVLSQASNGNTVVRCTYRALSDRVRIIGISGGDVGPRCGVGIAAVLKSFVSRVLTATVSRSGLVYQVDGERALQRKVQAAMESMPKPVRALWTNLDEVVHSEVPERLFSPEPWFPRETLRVGQFYSYAATLPAPPGNLGCSYNFLRFDRGKAAFSTRVMGGATAVPPRAGDLRIPKVAARGRGQFLVEAWSGVVVADAAMTTFQERLLEGPAHLNYLPAATSLCVIQKSVVTVAPLG